MSVNVPRRLSSLGCMNALASWAEQLAQALLQVPLPRRWAHVQGIAARARSLAPVLSADADLMEAAAWLHDIGYASALPSSVSSLLGTVNGILPANLALNPTSVAGGSTASGECSVLSGLLTQLNAANGTSPVTGLVTGILNQVLGLTGGNAASVEPLSIDLGGSTSAVSTSGNVVTDSVTQHAVDVNLFGLADLQVAPTTASVALDRTTGTVTPSCNAGLVSYSTSGSLPTFVSIGQLTTLVNQILAQVGASSALGSALGSLLTGIINYNPDGNLLTCDTSAPGTTASAKVGVINLGLLSALEGGIGLNVGDVSVTGSSTVATPAVATSPATASPATPVAATTPAVVPDVTTVHTGEYWAGTLPIMSDGGHGPGRPAAHRPAPDRLARPLSQFTQPPPRWLMSHHCRSSADRTADRHRARPSGPPPFPLRSRGPARRRPQHSTIDHETGVLRRSGQ